MTRSEPSLSKCETIGISQLEFLRYKDKVGELIEVKPGDWRFLSGIQYAPAEFEKYTMDVIVVDPVFIPPGGFSA